MNSIATFIETNRQLGSTTSLVKAAIENDGYLIVHNDVMRQHVLQMDWRLRSDRVFTLGELRNEKYRGRESRQIFVDAACMCFMKE